VATFEAIRFSEQFHFSGSTSALPEQPHLQAAGEDRPQGRAKILIADDNEMNALALEDYLTAIGYELYFAADGEQALARAEEVAPDIILMDIQMPKISGVEATRRLRSNPRFARTPILALTALAMPGDRELCLAAGASAYISKPFLLKDLVRMIEEWLQRSRNQHEA
jgi:CheY-like chemotaxis protein